MNTSTFFIFLLGMAAYLPMIAQEIPIKNLAIDATGQVQIQVASCSVISSQKGKFAQSDSKSPHYIVNRRMHKAELTIYATKCFLFWHIFAGNGNI